MTFNKFFRVFAFTLLIILSSILPVPMTFYGKDNLPKHLIEMLDKKEEEDDEGETETIS